MEQLDKEMDELDGAYANEFVSLADSFSFATNTRSAEAAHSAPPNNTNKSEL